MIEVNSGNVAEVAAKLKAGELPGPAKSLAEAMARVMENVGYVQKDRQMEFGQKYRYAGEAAFIAALRPELVRQGIVIAPLSYEVLTCEVFQGQKGPQNRVMLRGTFRFTHAPSGTSADFVACGEGMDVGDKATNKAMTNCMKYVLRQSFVIETGDDPDDTPSHTQERAAAQQPKPQPTPQPQRSSLYKAALDVALDGVGDRDALGRAWVTYDADVKAGKVSDADRQHFDKRFRDLSAKFPKPTQPAGKA